MSQGRAVQWSETTFYVCLICARELGQALCPVWALLSPWSEADRDCGQVNGCPAESGSYDGVCRCTRETLRP